ncbi:single-stranded DNA-binding protein [Actinophytocola sp.]|uniref:single-stranded DNA-binding protein n=1 Tax=Actinophytocola sp. TaxID=1872138 RepID=UPI002D7E35A0|nr:single-stranded DNA-binding protein [Actinophytocola sp.]HET9142181.1 single-stranded DNA-binding protein [Actinophytocola sp.]
MFETYLTVVGRVITDVTQRTTSTGDKVCGFRMVSTERRYDRDEQQWRDGDKLFVNVTCWRRLGENVAVSVFKGDPVVVTGRLHLNEYQVNGESRTTLELEAKAIGPNLSACTAMLQRPARDGTDGERLAPSGVAAA